MHPDLLAMIRITVIAGFIAWAAQIAIKAALIFL